MPPEPRRRARSVLLLIALVPGSATAASYHYQAYLASLPVGSARVDVELDDAAYVVSGQARTQGAMDSFSAWRATFEAIGGYGVAGVQPEWFGYTAVEPDRIRQVWVTDGLLREIRDGRPRDDRPAFPGDDLLSALFVQPGCPEQRELHSGRSGYRLTEGRVTGARCSYRVRDDEGGDYRVVFEFGLRQGLRVPVRIDVQGMLSGQLVLLDPPQ